MADVKQKIAFSVSRIAIVNNISLIVTLPYGNRAPFDPDIGVVIDNAKYEVCMWSGFESI